MFKWKTVLFIVFLVVSGWATMTYLSGKKTPPKQQNKGPDRRIVRVQSVQRQTLRPPIAAHGSIRPTQAYDLVSEVTGLTLAGDIPFLVGQQFQQGQTLLSIDDRQAKLTLETLKSDFLNALASVLPEIKYEVPQDSQEWLAYFQRCQKQSPMPELPETEHEKIALLLSRFGVNKLFFQIKNQEVILEKHRILAPFDGVLTATHLNPGAAVRPGSVMAHITSLNDMECALEVQVSDLPRMDREAPILVHWAGGAPPFPAQFLRQNSRVDESTRTVSIFAKPLLEDPQVLMEGAFITAEIPSLPIDQAVEVPLRLLRSENTLLVIEGDLLQERTVGIVQKTTTTAVIDRGLSDGDLLVMDVLQGIAPNTPVTVLPIDGDSSGN
jgi:multidrug efflux pump subunit AcrA (membrane-fusion protein)